jgi:UDP-N-acetylmuramyl tripeptide synthase
VAGGRVGLALDPTLLTTLAQGRPVALVSGTNGKTTTTRLLAAAVTSPAGGSVASNATGANMPAGHVAALVGSPVGVPAVLEVDEGYLGRLIDETRPRVILLLNLSRDQLDRISEVRMVVERWREATGRLSGPAPDGSPGTVVVANADDPMVVRAAGAAPDVRWVGAGQVWRQDAAGCPVCGGGIDFGGDGSWACDRCDFARPQPQAWVEGEDLVCEDGTRIRLALRLPGQFNRANAAMAVVAAPFMGGPTLTPAVALARMASVDEVAGRFAASTRHGRSLRLLLAKNPAGWTALFDLLDESGSPRSPLVLSVNARTADGLDTSWLWDVPFERLGSGGVVATGDRRRDLAVRLRYAEVDHEVVADPLAAVDRAIALSTSDPPPGHRLDRPLDIIANYTAFADLRRRL